MSRPAQIFISYAHADEAHRKRLEAHLAPLLREGLIAPWHDRRIPPGSEWDAAIDENLAKADVILLLVSADFVASDYCYKKELALALERHERKEARVIPIIVAPVDFGKTPFAKLQALPRNAEPVSMWSNPEEAWRDVAIGVRQVIGSGSQAAPPRANLPIERTRPAWKPLIAAVLATAAAVIGTLYARSRVSPSGDTTSSTATITSNSAHPPDWTCREPAVFLSARCEAGGLDRSDKAGKVRESEGVVRGWQSKEQTLSTFCDHASPGEGTVKTRSSCEAKDGAVRLTLANRVEGKGGYSARKDCASQEKCLTYLAFRIDEGGAAVRISQDDVERYDLQVDSFNCTDKPSMGDQKVGVQATFLGDEIQLVAGRRYELTQAGLIELHLQGNLKFQVDYGKDAFSGITACAVSLSLQPHQEGAVPITPMAREAQ